MSDEEVGNEDNTYYNLVVEYTKNENSDVIPISAKTEEI